MEEKTEKKYLSILTYFLAAVSLRLLFSWIPGVFPILPIALYTGMLYGLEAALSLAVIAVFTTGFILEGSFDSFTIAGILVAVGMIVASLVLTVKILKIGKHGIYSASALLDRVIVATLFLGIGLSLMKGALFIYPDFLYHLIANMLFVGIIALLSKGEQKKEK